MILFLVAGLITFAGWLFAFVLYDSSYEKKNSNLKFHIGLLLTALLWVSCAWGASIIEADIEAERAERKAYYEKCIVEIETRVQDKVQFYSKTDNCLKK